MATLLNDTDLTGWYNKLNTVRQKENIVLGTVAVPSVDKKRADASVINSFFDQVNTLKSNTYLRHSYGWTDWDTAIKDIKTSTKINLSLKNSIE